MTRTTSFTSTRTSLRRTGAEHHRCHPVGGTSRTVLSHSILEDTKIRRPAIFLKRRVKALGEGNALGSRHIAHRRGAGNRSNHPETQRGSRAGTPPVPAGL